jgi:hypothetical protein
LCTRGSNRALLGGPSTSPLVVMNISFHARALFVVIANCLSCVYAGDGDSSKPAFILTFDGPAHACRVTLSDTSVTKAMPCSQVVLYLSNELKLPKGSSFDWRTITDVDEHEYTQTLKALTEAGYLGTPGTHVNFITEPHSGHDH